MAGRPLSSGTIPRAQAPDMTMRSGVLMGSGSRVLWGRVPTSRGAMASITKLMTALVVLDKCALDDIATVPAEARRVDSAIGLQTGERLTVRELLEYLLVVSSNDAAITLAVHTGGSVPKFAAMMNARAKAMGLKNSAFKNPHGLDTAGHFSSSADIATMMRAAMENPEFLRIEQLRSVTLPARSGRGTKQIKATNRLLGSFAGLLGGKTGFTDDAGRSFVASARRGDVTLTAVVLNAGGDPARFDSARRLLEWGFAHVRAAELTTMTSDVTSAPVAANPSYRVGLRYGQSAAVEVCDLGGPVTSKVMVSPKVRLPIFEGQPLGEAVFVQGGTPISRVPLVASEDLISAQENVGVVPVGDYIDRTVGVRAAASGADVAEYDTTKPVKRVVDLDDTVAAPVEVGEVVGRISYYQGSKLIGRVPAVAAGKVEAPALADRVGIWFARGWLSLTGKPTVASPRISGA